MKCIVIGSGPSGANAALTLLSRGKTVELWDVGKEESQFPFPEADFHELKALVEDPQEYFLGKQFEALMPPGGAELLRYPPSRKFLVNAKDDLWPFAGDEFKPFMSFTQGGLGVGWGANAVSFDDDDIKDWPISIADLSQAYAESCRRIPIAGPIDSLSPFFPGVAVTHPPMRISRHDSNLLDSFGRRSSLIRKTCHTTIGQARLAVVNSPDHLSSCRHCGRCLWGCPHGSLYDPARTTLQECRRYPNFNYKPGRLVVHFEAKDGQITGIHYFDVHGRQALTAPCESVFLAAGALQSGGIFLRTIQNDSNHHDTVDDRSMTQSVMDTTVVKVPYIQIRSVGCSEGRGQFQFNRLIIANRKKRDGSWPMHCHGEVLSLNTLIYHALIESIPLGSRLAMRLFSRFHTALGVATFFFPDRQLPGNGLSLITDPTSATGDRMHVHYKEGSDKEALIREVIRDTQRALLLLGCIPLQPIRARPGSGIHYAGTVPMGSGVRCSDSSGRANAYRNLYLCDGAAFPSLPSKSITLNLVAHAIRVASLAQV